MGAPERGHADEAPSIAVDAKPRRGLHALDDRAPGAQVAVQEVDVGAAPAALEVHDEPAAVVGEGDVWPRLLVRQIGEARCVGLGGVAEPVPPHGAVVARVVVPDLRRVRVARVREAAAVGQPRHRRGAGVGEDIREQRAGGHLEDPQRRALVAPGRRAERDQVAVRGWLVPVDRGGGRAARIGRIDQDPAGALDRLGERADHEGGPVVAGPSVDREEAFAADRGRRRGAGLGQLRQAGAEPPPGRDGVEGGSGSIVLGGGPGPDLVGGAVLQPAVRVRDLDAVEGLDDVVDPGGRGRRDLVQGVGYELRPRLGFRPWLAFFLRARWVAFLVRFDIGAPRYRRPPGRSSLLAGTAGQLLGREGAEDAELVAVGVGEHDPAHVVALADVDPRGAHGLGAGDLGRPGRSGAGRCGGAPSRPSAPAP